MSRPLSYLPEVRPLIRALALAALLAGCEDPVLQEQLDALGPESADVLPGPLHRPGQPCLRCHAPTGPASPFTVAGTVFQKPESDLRVGGVEVRLIDAAHRTHLAYTNCAGNFFVSPQEFEPVLPLWVSLNEPRQGLHSDMESAMNKDGDCGACHQGKKSPSSAGQVFLTEDPAVPDPAASGPCGGSKP